MPAAKTRRTAAGEPSPDQRPARERAVAREITFLLRRLRTKIKTQGFTQKGVAGALGWNPSALSDVLHGQASVPLDRVLLICRVIGLTSAELFLDHESPAEQHLQLLLETRKHPGQVLSRVDEAELMSATRELLAAAEKRLELLSASERSYLAKVVRWCEASIALDKQARRRRSGQRLGKQGSDPGHLQAKRILWPDFKEGDK